MIIKDPVSGFIIGDPEKNPLPALKAIPFPEVQAEFNKLILSSSGWRKIFAASGDQESPEKNISPADAVLCSCIGTAFAKFCLQQLKKDSIRTAVAIDTRPTGPVIADICIRALCAWGISVKYLFIAAAPEIMAYVRKNEDIDSFLYISASHNPVGHNGIKFGFSDGGVLSGSEADALIRLFTDIVKDETAVGECRKKAAETDSKTLSQIFETVPSVKESALRAYYNFSLEVVSGREGKEAAHSAPPAEPFGILAEFNGSARTMSIDKSFFQDAGYLFRGINDKPGTIVHTIVPEGRSLDLCRLELEKAYKKNSAFQIGYVPDNDGDRGNLVYIDSETASARILHAQEVFALSVVSELAYLVYMGKGDQKCAVVVNGSTSLRINRITEFFGVELHRAEVGEANVVSLAKDLRKKGYTVRILGEGSNGGNITHPSAVRDPLDTVCAIAKLFTLPPNSRGETLISIWNAKNGAAHPYQKYLLPEQVLKTLPQFTTTSVYEPRALLSIQTEDHGVLKEKYEKFFLSAWEEEKPEVFGKKDLVSFREVNYEGIYSREGFGRKYRTGNERGGLAMIFQNSEGRDSAFVWMRGSKTEPVFRVMADVEGNDERLEKQLLSWHTEIIMKADT